MCAMASQITSFTIVYSTIYLSAEQRKYQSSESLAFVRGIHRGPVNSPHKGPVTRKMLPFDDAIMTNLQAYILAKMQILASNNLPKCKFWQVITPLLLWQQNKVIPDTGIPIIKIGGHYNVNLYIGKIASLYWNSTWRIHICITVSEFDRLPDRTQVGPMLAPWTLLSGQLCHSLPNSRGTVGQPGR